MANFNKDDFSCIYKNRPKISGYYPCAASFTDVNDAHDNPENIDNYYGLFEYYDASTKLWESPEWGIHSNKRYWFGLNRLSHIHYLMHYKKGLLNE